MNIGTTKRIVRQYFDNTGRTWWREELAPNGPLKLPAGEYTMKQLGMGVRGDVWFVRYEIERIGE